MAQMDKFGDGVTHLEVQWEIEPRSRVGYLKIHIIT